MFGMVLNTTWLEFKDMAQDPLVRLELVSAWCNRRRMRVWRHKNATYTPRNIQPTVPYDGGSVMVWGCISHDCKLDLVTIQGNLTGDQYIRDVLQPVISPHCNNHPLSIRPVYMVDNARPHRSRAVTPASKAKPWLLFLGQQLARIWIP
jgi:hypothetical protein